MWQKLGLNGIALPSLVAYAISVAYTSLTPVDEITISVWDKLLHFLCYGVFALLAWWCSKRATTFYWLLGFVSAYGALMEVGQSFVPGRDMSGLDIVANTLGVAAVLVVYLLWPRQAEATVSSS